MGRSIQDYMLTVRVFNAKLYLNKGYSVKEAALMCGFNDPNNFTKLFKKKTGYTPTQWKAKMALNEDNVPPYPQRDSLNQSFLQTSTDLDPLLYDRKKEKTEQ